MGYPKLSFRSKAAHLVSDFTTVILNPISDEPSTPRVSWPEEQGMNGPEKPDAESESRVPDGPDTSSFSAFLVSLLSSTESSSHSKEESNEHNAETEDIPSTSEIKGSGGRKGLIGRGKQSFGKVLNKAARMSGYRYYRSEQKSSGDMTKDSDSAGHELMPLNVTKDAASQFKLPDISEPSLLLSESTRGALYLSLPVQVKGRNWVLLYRILSFKGFNLFLGPIWGEFYNGLIVRTWRHGISLSTLYRRSMLCPGYSLLTVGDQKGAVFGGLVEAPLRPTTKKKYQGSNSTFVFTNLPSDPVIFRPTGANRYYTLCSTDFLALGGGGHFALYLDGDLLNGSSYASDTYGNSCLAHAEDFSIKEVELWGFVYASKYEETLELCRTEAPGICRW